jgi:hypothetical protein
VPLDCRLHLCNGICQVLCALPADKVANAIQSFSSKPRELIERFVGDTTYDTSSKELSVAFSYVSDEIRVLSRMVHVFTKTCISDSPSNCQPFHFSSFEFIGSVWHSIKHIATNFSSEKVRFASHFTLQKVLACLILSPIVHSCCIVSISLRHITTFLRERKRPSFDTRAMLVGFVD